eukprot:jgi/Bigna1/78513/fgenesh1_pg.55_\
MRLLFLLLLSPLPAFSSLPPPPSLRRLRTRVQGEESPRGEGEGLCEALKDKPDVEFSLGGLLSHGDVLTNQIIGLQVEAYSNRLQGPGSAVIFDSNGSWENDVDLQVGVGNLVIIQDPTSRAPDDDRLGGSLTFRFACPVTVLQVTMVDIDDENVGTIMCYDENDIKLASVPIPNEGESSVNKLPVVVASVSTMRIALRSSGAVARIKIRVASPGGLTAAPIQEAVATSSPTVKKTTSPSVGLSSLSPTTVFPNKTNVPCEPIDRDSHLPLPILKVSSFRGPCDGGAGNECTFVFKANNTPEYRLAQNGLPHAYSHTLSDQQPKHYRPDVVALVLPNWKSSNGQTLDQSFNLESLLLCSNRITEPNSVDLYSFDFPILSSPHSEYDKPVRRSADLLRRIASLPWKWIYLCAELFCEVF